MDVPLRKRVTKVGSGAWSIYLPKKWIDQWEPEQQAGREVEVRSIGEGMLITPTIVRSRYKLELQPQQQLVRVTLLSAYLRGYHNVQLSASSGVFDNDCIAGARDFMRHLDERLEARCSPTEIGFRLRADLPSAIGSADDLMQMMGAKVDEVLRLAHDAVSSYWHDPDRALHALRLLRDTHEEDVARLFHQATRLVATLEIPMPSVTAYQLLGLVAADLHRVSETGIRVAHGILQEYQLEPADLDYPRAHVLKTLVLPGVASGVSKTINRVASAHFEPTRELLRTTMNAVMGRDIEALMSVPIQAEALTNEIRRGVFEGVAAVWGQEDAATDPMQVLASTRHTTSIIQALDHIRTIATTALALKAADEP